MQVCIRQSTTTQYILLREPLFCQGTYQDCHSTVPTWLPGATWLPTRQSRAQGISGVRGNRAHPRAQSSMQL